MVQLFIWYVQEVGVVYLQEADVLFPHMQHWNIYYKYTSETTCIWYDYDTPWKCVISLFFFLL